MPLLGRVVASAVAFVNKTNAIQKGVLPLIVAWRNHSVAAGDGLEALATRANNISSDCALSKKTIPMDIHSFFPGRGQVVVTNKMDDKGQSNLAHLANSANNVQGGIITAIHDLAACEAVSSSGFAGEGINISVQFLKPIPIATTDLVEVHAQVISQTRRYATVSSNVYCNGALASTADLTFNIRMATKEEALLREEQLKERAAMRREITGGAYF